MNGNYYTYALTLNKIGDEIVSISDTLLINNRASTLEEMKRDHEKYIAAINNYKKCKEDILNVIPPNLVKDEHEQMVNSIDLFIKGTELMSNGIDVENCTINKKLINDGYVKQEQGKRQVVMLANKIAKKLTD